MIVQQCRLDRGYQRYADEYRKKACEVLDSAYYILGKEVDLFEKEFAAYIGTKHCIGVGNGTDALYLAFRALNIGAGDEVLLPANAFVADYLSIVHTGAKPVPVDTENDYLMDCQKLENKITAHTKAILAVHLYGGAVDMLRLNGIAKKHGLKVVEDCAQSAGTEFCSQKTGTFGDFACFSFYPTKNLGAFGDGGAVLTDDDTLAQKIRELRYYGSVDKVTYTSLGINSRLDELQAGLLRVRLSHLDEFLDERRKTAEFYFQNIRNSSVILPQVKKETVHTFHQFVIRCEKRDELREYLAQNGIKTGIHYAILPYLTPAYSFLGYHTGVCSLAEKINREIISLPMYDGITQEDVTYVTSVMNRFQTTKR